MQCHPEERDSNSSRTGVAWPFPASHSTYVLGLSQNLPVLPPFTSLTSSKLPFRKTGIPWGKGERRMYVGECNSRDNALCLLTDPFQGCQGVLPPFIFKAGRCGHPGSSLLLIGLEIYLCCGFLTGSSVVLALNLHGNPCSRDTEWKLLAWGGQQQNTDLPGCLQHRLHFNTFPDTQRAKNTPSSV